MGVDEVCGLFPAEEMEVSDLGSQEGIGWLCEPEVEIEGLGRWWMGEKVAEAAKAIPEAGCPDHRSRAWKAAARNRTHDTIPGT